MRLAQTDHLSACRLRKMVRRDLACSLTPRDRSPRQPRSSVAHHFSAEPISPLVQSFRFMAGNTTAPPIRSRLRCPSHPCWISQRKLRSHSLRSRRPRASIRHGHGFPQRTGKTRATARKKHLTDPSRVAHHLAGESFSASLVRFYLAPCAGSRNTDCPHQRRCRTASASRSFSGEMKRHRGIRMSSLAIPQRPRPVLAANPLPPRIPASAADATSPIPPRDHMTKHRSMPLATE